jgi:plasmid stabilization system protein ParE
MVLRDLIILPEAEQDATQAYDWYEEQGTGTGLVDVCMQSIRRNPEMYQIVYESYRRAVVRRFPYVVFYQHSDLAVTVYAVFHCSQDPKKWRSRLP